MDDTEEDNLLSMEFDPEPPEKRDICERCRRPISVCWCPYLPNPPPSIRSSVIILQHPYEDKRGLSTTLMLEQGLPPGYCHIIKGTRFNPAKYPILEDVLHSPDTVLLYPSSTAESIETLATDRSYNLILLDGTWMQARGLFGKNSFLNKIRRVKLPKPPLSKYLIRTQPYDECLSTLECAAFALQILENNPNIFEMLTRPLKALCDFQMAHGAVEHQSRDYMKRNGLYVPRSERTKTQRNVPTQSDNM